MVSGHWTISNSFLLILLRNTKMKKRKKTQNKEGMSQIK